MNRYEVEAAAMQVMLTFTLQPETRDETIARFATTEGQPPSGATLLGRWTELDLCGGFALLEREDPNALTAFAHAWSDLLELTIAPVLKDQELSDVLTPAMTRAGRCPEVSQTARQMPLSWSSTSRTRPRRSVERGVTTLERPLHHVLPFTSAQADNSTALER